MTVQPQAYIMDSRGSALIDASAAAAASVPSPAGYGAPPMAARLQERIFPRLLWRHAPEIFSFSDCSFKVQRSKESTARVVCHREFNLFNSFTVEASFAGSTKGRLAGYHFSANHLESLGAAFGEALLSYISPAQAPLNAALRALELIYPGQAAAGGGTSSPPQRAPHSLAKMVTATPTAASTAAPDASPASSLASSLF